MAGWPKRLGHLLSGAWSAGPPGFRFLMLEFSFIALVVGIWGVASNRGATVVLGSLGAAVLLLLLAIAAQYVAERTGLVERQRIRDEERRAEMVGWPQWKRVAFVVLALLVGAGAIALKVWTQGH